MPRPLFCRNGCWDPFEEKTQMNLFDQNTGLPCFLEPGEVSWIDSTRKRLTAFSWSGSLCLPLFNSLRMEILPTCIGPQGHISDAACKQTEQNWKVCLDVNPYSLEDISIKTKEGYLEITGNREERQENNRLISRSFTRKYKLPFDLDPKQISTVLSPDGILSVEAPLTGSEVALPDETVIPIRMMDKPGFH
ncbi:heat shock protein, alpha-crystallin-related, b15 [Triplophysa rosa]|uniref:Heat shock protein beta-1-like n=1 Tax=Triplophysa rosa TaxID=992332 RepID=A0A9W8CB76_TRIRA|nr:heat shock protein, alpha-crystallin-related, b15 [Triplophysa rosa]XP_057177610.1 heat shock protein, alpha-crystallin-related, b15 [Triplophysa rosa]XP_057177621.1 heat shock protein, alpha-crystallin-related, b15 [Triplophysa rosa]KAI7813402.1 putative heat shock protein beta-1-like [Triplophysa rosa]